MIPSVEAIEHSVAARPSRTPAGLQPRASDQSRGRYPNRTHRIDMLAMSMPVWVKVTSSSAVRMAAA